MEDFPSTQVSTSNIMKKIVILAAVMASSSIFLHAGDEPQIAAASVDQKEKALKSIRVYTPAEAQKIAQTPGRPALVLYNLNGEFG